MERGDKTGWTTVSISAESKRLLELHAVDELPDIVPRADGRYDVKLREVTIERLRQYDADIDRAIEYIVHRKH
jgi:hypothetical protein